MTVCALANSTGNSDWLISGGIADVEAIGVDELAGVGDLAAQSDGEAAHGCAEGAARFEHIARERDVADAIGGFGQLAHEAARCLEGAVHVPEGAGATEAGELQACGAVAFGDGAGLVDADEEEGDALGTGALQG